MLHEIFKGMDNAAEKINENFSELSYEEGSNENGRWRKYADGRLECERVLSLNSRDLPINQLGDIYYHNFKWVFPEEFLNNEMIIKGSISTSTVAWITTGLATNDRTEMRILFARDESTRDAILHLRLKAEGYTQ